MTTQIDHTIDYYDELAEHLGGTVKERHEGWRVTIALPDQPLAAISIVCREQEMRLYIAGEYPVPPGSVLRHEEKAPEITVSAERPAEDAARDIRRRLLPAYLELLPQTVVCHHRNLARQRRQKEIAVEIGEALRRHPSMDPYGDHNPRISWKAEGAEFGSFEVGYGGTVRIDLQAVPAETAVAVAALLRECAAADTGSAPQSS